MRVRPCCSLRPPLLTCCWQESRSSSVFKSVRTIGLLLYLIPHLISLSFALARQRHLLVARSAPFLDRFARRSAPRLGCIRPARLERGQQLHRARRGHPGQWREPGLPQLSVVCVVGRRQTPALTLLAARPADAYGPLVAYMFSWTAVSLLKPGSAAIIALIFGEYVMRLVYSSSVAPESADGKEPVSTEAPEWTFKLLGCISELFGLTRAAASLTTDTPPVVPDPVILVVTAINIANARAGAHVQVGLTSIKVRTRLGSLLAPF